MDDLVAWLRAQIQADEAEHPAPDAVPIVYLDAMRAVVDLHDAPNLDGYAGICNECADSRPCQTLRHLASAYAHRTGYRDEWRPWTTVDTAPGDVTR